MLTKLVGLSLGAIGSSGVAIFAQQVGLPKITEGGALTLAGFLVYWVCREYVKMREEAKTEREAAAAAHREERKELVDSLKGLTSKITEVSERNTTAYDGLIATLRQRPCILNREQERP